VSRQAEIKAAHGVFYFGNPLAFWRTLLGKGAVHFLFHYLSKAGYIWIGHGQLFTITTKNE